MSKKVKEAESVPAGNPKVRKQLNAVRELRGTEGPAGNPLGAVRKRK